ncbi:hypothetical protein ACLMJK_004755 [Lecanora helva]
MPKIMSYTPSWLSRPSPGFNVFNTAQSTSLAYAEDRGYRSKSEYEYNGPNRTIAQRGTEIFVAAGKRIRWADLVSLKDGYEEQLRTPSRKPKSGLEGSRADLEEDGPEDASYRVLKVPISEQIRQLAVSPNGNLLAIATAHTVHIAILPDSSHLGQIPNKQIRLKAFHVGPTAHVLSQSQVTNTLWHPCGAGGNCLVTVTADAAVRLWEFNGIDRYSVNTPSLAIDLKKLMIASSAEDNVTPDDFTTNRGFSPDDAGLEVASACFGGNGSSFESGWSPVTLWIAMKDGDIYALCPLLPSKWQPPATLISSISADAMAKDASEDGVGKGLCHDQLEWIRDVDGQEPMLQDSHDEFAPRVEIYSRPSYPGSIPRLQGPFQMFAEDANQDQEFLEFSDIHVVASKISAEDFDDDSDSEAESLDEGGLSASIVALITTVGRVYVCLDLEGVEGQWLPQKKPKNSDPTSIPKDPYLVILEGLDTLTTTDQLDIQWPTFTPDTISRNSLFITHAHGVFYLSFTPWISTLESELQNSETLGAPLRIDLIRNGPGTLRERILSFNSESEEEDTTSAVRSISTCCTFSDSDIGHFLLTTVNNHPEAVTFNPSYEPRNEPTSNNLIKQEEDDPPLPSLSQLNLGPLPREIYQPPDPFYAPSSLPHFLSQTLPHRHRQVAKTEIRLSTLTLDLMTQAHRLLSAETHRLGLAASDLFRRCERLREELLDQVSRADEVAKRVEVAVGEDADDYSQSVRGKRPGGGVRERVEACKRRQGELQERFEALRKKCSNSGGRKLGEKEQAWIEEVDRVHVEITSPSLEREGDGDKEDEDGEEEGNGELWRRCRVTEDLKTDLIARTKEISLDNHHEEQQINGDNSDTDSIPNGIHRSKIVEVQRMLDLQSAKVDEAVQRLRRMGELVVS